MSGCALFRGTDLLFAFFTQAGNGLMNLSDRFSAHMLIRMLKE